jgi:hypothetical protein
MQLDTRGVGVVEFDLGDAQKLALRDQGWDAADEFLRSWSWTDYLEMCRK